MTELKVRPYTMLPSGQCYDRDEVNKVIAEKDKEITKLKEQVQEERSAKVNYKISANDLSDGLKDAYEEIKHHKYKRCLAMANYWVAVSYQCVDDKHRQNAKRHHRKWLELAEKFKEVS